MSTDDVKKDDRIDDPAPETVEETDEIVEERQEDADDQHRDENDPGMLAEDGRYAPDTVATPTAMLAGFGFGMSIASVMVGAALVGALILKDAISAAVLTGIGTLIVFCLCLWLGYNRRSVAPFSKLDVLAATTIEMLLIVSGALLLPLLEPLGIDLAMSGTVMAFLGAMVITSALAEKLHRNGFALSVMLVCGAVLILMAPSTTWFIPALAVGAVAGLLIGLTCRVPIRHRHQRFVPAED